MAEFIGWAIWPPRHYNPPPNFGLRPAYPTAAPMSVRDPALYAVIKDMCEFVYEPLDWVSLLPPGDLIVYANDFAPPTADDGTPP